MTQEDLIKAFMNAHKKAQQGDKQAALAAKELAEAIQSGKFAKTNKKTAEVSQDGSILDPLAQGVSFGFADEIAGGVGAAGNSVYDFFSGGDSGSFSDNYDRIRDKWRSDNEAFSKRNPKTALAAEIAGGLLTGGAGAARVGALRGAQTIGRLAGLGAVQGTIAGAGHSKAEDLKGVTKDAAIGGLLGGGLGAATPAIGRAVGGVVRGVGRGVNRALGGGLNNVEQQAVQTLDDFGIPLTAGQRAGTRPLQQTETTLADIPFVGGPLNSVLSNQRQVYQSRLLRLAGFTDDDAVQGLVSPEAIQRAYDRFSHRYAEALGDTSVEVNERFVNTLINAGDRYASRIGAKGVPTFRRTINDIFDRATEGRNMRLSGEDYQAIRRDLGTLERSAGDNHGLRNAYRDIKRELDQAFLNAAGTTRAAIKRNLDNEYAHLIQIDDLVRKGSGDTANGNIPIGMLARKAAKSPGSQEWRNLTSAAKAILPDKVPNSGTAARGITGGLLLTGGATSPAAMIPLAVASRVGASALSNPLAVQRGAQALGRGVDRLGLLATPSFVAQQPLNSNR